MVARNSFKFFSYIDWRICRAAIAHAGFGVVSWYKAGKMVVCLLEF
jgi:hypothetical protein